MGEGLKMRKRQPEKSKEKLQSLEFVTLPQELKNGMARKEEKGRRNRQRNNITISQL
jgi:hypothetical protein